MNFQETIISLLGDLHFDGELRTINTASYYIETKNVKDKMFLSIRIKDTNYESLEEFKNIIIAIISDLCLTINLVCLEKKEVKFIVSKQ